MNVVAYGGGSNSTAMIIGMHRKSIPIDIILFADTGAEMPHTYEYIPVMNRWLTEHGLPEIITVEYTDQNGDRLTLEDECLRSGTLPSLAYGFKKCSLKHKISPQDKYFNNHPKCREIWAAGERAVRYIGFDAGEEHRRSHAFVYDIQDKKFKKEYPLIDWGWFREDCVEAIKQEGLPLPGKSSCFFCPAMKKHEIRTLYHKHRDLYDRAIAIEDTAKDSLYRVKGLGRNWSWRSFVEADRQQIVLSCDMFSDNDMPCSCYDGE
jgi:hypothetical protein